MRTLDSPETGAPYCSGLRAFRRASFLVLLAAYPLLGLNPALSVVQYLHTRWTQEEGNALPPITALAQSGDGYLWLGTANGLIRFDGMRFVDWAPTGDPQLPNARVRCLRTAADGALWIGTASGVCRLERGRIRRYPASEKRPCNIVNSMMEDRNHGLWMLNSCTGYVRLEFLAPDGSMTQYGVEDGLPQGEIRSMFQDSHGQIWVGVRNAICRWSPGVPATCSEKSGIDPLSIGEAHDRLLVADGQKETLWWFSSGQFETAGPEVHESPFMPDLTRADRDGNVWVGTAGKGLVRFGREGAERFTSAEGLSSNVINGIVEDREGVLWVATARGIDRLRDPAVVFLPAGSGLDGKFTSAVLGAGDGSTWIGTVGAGLGHVRGNAIDLYSTRNGLPNTVVTSLFEDSLGRLWVGTSAGLVVRSGDRFHGVQTADGKRLDRVLDMTADATGAIWLADAAKGVFVSRGGAAVRLATPPLADPDIYRLLVARNGDLWIGHFKKGGVSVVNGGTVTDYSMRNGMAPGPVRSIYQDTQGAIWVGTDGLNRFDGGRWKTWTVKNGLPEGGVQSIVQDGRGGLWLMMPAGVLRLPYSSLNDTTGSLPVVLYGRSEGLRINDGGGAPTPRMSRSRDGKLWVCTDDGAAAIDPTRVRTNPVPPSVIIEQATIDGRNLAIGTGHEIDFRGRDLRISFTGISLTAPERVHFRYRMVGLDRDWTDAGTSRNVAFANLAPRGYRFQVIASNNDGVWNNAGAELAFRVVPYFYETPWFIASCLGTVLLLGWGIHRSRVRRVVERFRLIAQERARFARELHDSLLQGFSGVVYQLDAASRQFESDPEASKRRLARALDQADASLRESRQMIMSMRIPALENSTLPEAIEATARQAVEGLPVQFGFRLSGPARQGHYDVEANVFLIAREAVANAINHASATHIEVELQYQGRGLSLLVRDDGTGMDPDAAAAKPGHWGLRSMRERATRLGAEFEIKSSCGIGTTVIVRAALE